MPAGARSFSVASLSASLRLRAGVCRQRVRLQRRHETIPDEVHDRRHVARAARDRDDRVVLRQDQAVLPDARRRRDRSRGGSARTDSRSPAPNRSSASCRWTSAATSPSSTHAAGMSCLPCHMPFCR